MFVSVSEDVSQRLNQFYLLPNEWFFDDPVKKERADRWSDQQKCVETHMAIFPGEVFGTIVAYQTK